ncbi:MAG: hypothetical protein ACREPT_06800 [Rudaea sp.]
MPVAPGVDDWLADAKPLLGGTGTGFGKSLIDCYRKNSLRAPKLVLDKLCASAA